MVRRVAVIVEQLPLDRLVGDEGEQRLRLDEAIERHGVLGTQLELRIGDKYGTHVSLVPVAEVEKDFARGFRSALIIAGTSISLLASSHTAVARCPDHPYRSVYGAKER